MQNEETKKVEESEENKETKQVEDKQEEVTKTEDESTKKADETNQEDNDKKLTEDEQLAFNKQKEEERKSANALKEQNAQYKQEIEQLKALAKMNSLGIIENKQEDFLAIIKGKGLQLTEENIIKLAESHPEWKQASSESGVTKLGTNQGQSSIDQEQIDKAKVAKLFK